MVFTLQKTLDDCECRFAHIEDRHAHFEFADCQVWQLLGSEVLGTGIRIRSTEGNQGQIHLGTAMKDHSDGAAQGQSKMLAHWWAWLSRARKGMAAPQLKKSQAEPHLKAALKSWGWTTFVTIMQHCLGVSSHNH